MILWLLLCSYFSLSLPHSCFFFFPFPFLLLSQSIFTLLSLSLSFPPLSEGHALGQGQTGQRRFFHSQNPSLPERCLLMTGSHEAEQETHFKDVSSPVWIGTSCSNKHTGTESRTTSFVFLIYGSDALK